MLFWFEALPPYKNSLQFGQSNPLSEALISLLILKVSLVSVTVLLYIPPNVLVITYKLLSDNLMFRSTTIHIKLSHNLLQLFLINFFIDFLLFFGSYGFISGFATHLPTTANHLFTCFSIVYFRIMFASFIIHTQR